LVRTDPCFTSRGPPPPPGGRPPHRCMCPVGRKRGTCAGLSSGLILRPSVSGGEKEGHLCRAFLRFDPAALGVEEAVQFAVHPLFLPPSIEDLRHSSHTVCPLLAAFQWSILIVHVSLSRSPTPAFPLGALKTCATIFRPCVPFVAIFVPPLVFEDPRHNYQPVCPVLPSLPRVCR